MVSSSLEMSRLIALLLGLFAITCSAESDGGPDSSCTPGMAYACNCADGSPGAASCNLDGTPGVCVCTGGDPTGTDATSATTAATSTSDDACTTGCGDTTTAGSSEGGACGPIVAGKVDNVAVPWSFSGQTGLSAGAAMCTSIGADHLCDYEEVLLADQAGELAGMVNITAWIHRTTVESVEGVPSAPGPGGRCVDWSDGTGTLADGEWVEFAADGLVYHLDPDTFYDGLDGSHTDALAFPCMAVARSLLCCNPTC
jgi:hypothetical protein